MSGSMLTRPLRRLRAAVVRRLVPNWLRVAQRSWSFRLGVIAALLSGCELLVPLLPTFIEIPPGIFAAASFFVGVAAPISRLIHQTSLSGDRNDQDAE